MAQERYDEANPPAVEVLASRRRSTGHKADHPDIATNLINLAEVHMAQGRYDEAEPLMEEALAMDRRVVLIFGLDKDHPSIARDLSCLIMLYVRQGRYDQAEPLMVEVLAMTTRVHSAGLRPRCPVNAKWLARGSRCIAKSIGNLATLIMAQGRYDEAEPLLVEALARMRRVHGTEKDHPDIAASLSNLAALYKMQGLYVQAEPLMGEALAMDRRVRGADKAHPDIATDLNNLAALYEAQGRYYEAESLYVEVLAIWRRVHGADEGHYDIATGLTNLAAVKEKQGSMGESVDHKKRKTSIGHDGPTGPSPRVKGWTGTRNNVAFGVVAALHTRTRTTPSRPVPPPTFVPVQRRTTTTPKKKDRVKRRSLKSKDATPFFMDSGERVKEVRVKVEPIDPRFQVLGDNELQNRHDHTVEKLKGIDGEGCGGGGAAKSVTLNEVEKDRVQEKDPDDQIERVGEGKSPIAAVLAFERLPGNMESESEEAIATEMGSGGGGAPMTLTSKECLGILKSCATLRAAGVSREELFRCMPALSALIQSIKVVGGNIEGTVWAPPSNARKECLDILKSCAAFRAAGVSREELFRPPVIMSHASCMSLWVQMARAQWHCDTCESTNDAGDATCDLCGSDRGGAGT